MVLGFMKNCIVLLIMAISASLSRSLRVLCLHGKGETGASFIGSLAPLTEVCKRRGLEVEWISPNAPHSIPGHNGYAWWNLPPGFRSFETKEYLGLQQTFELIESQYPVDAIMGFSQGAILTSVLLLRGLQGKSKYLPNAAILCGAAWPNPFDAEMLALDTKQAQVVSSLHVIGTRDKVNPPAMAMKICDIFGGKLIEHPGGHIVPVGDGYVEEYVNVIEQISSRA